MIRIRTNVIFLQERCNFNKPSRENKYGNFHGKIEVNPQLNTYLNLLNALICIHISATLPLKTFCSLLLRKMPVIHNAEPPVLSSTVLNGTKQVAASPVLQFFKNKGV